MMSTMNTKEVASLAGVMELRAANLTRGMIVAGDVGFEIELFVVTAARMAFAEVMVIEYVVWKHRGASGGVPEGVLLDMEEMVTVVGFNRDMTLSELDGGTPFCDGWVRGKAIQIQDEVTFQGLTPEAVESLRERLKGLYSGDCSRCNASESSDVLEGNDGICASCKIEDDKAFHLLACIDCFNALEFDDEQLGLAPGTTMRQLDRIYENWDALAYHFDIDTEEDDKVKGTTFSNERCDLCTTATPGDRVHYVLTERKN